VVLGGQGEPIVAALKDSYRDGLSLGEALALAIRGLGTVGGDNGRPRELAANQLEVAVLDRGRPNRKFRRVQGAALTALLPPAPAAAPDGQSSAGGSIDVAAEDRLYRLLFDGSIFDEPEYVVLGGQGEPIVAALKESYRPGLTLAEALALAIRGLGTVGGDNGKPRDLAANQLEVAVLDRTRPNRKFRRVQGPALTALLPTAAAAGPDGAAQQRSSGSIDVDATEDPEEGSPS